MLEGRRGGTPLSRYGLKKLPMGVGREMTEKGIERSESRTSTRRQNFRRKRRGVEIHRVPYGHRPHVPERNGKVRKRLRVNICTLNGEESGRHLLVIPSPEGQKKGERARGRRLFVTSSRKWNRENVGKGPKRTARNCYSPTPV